MNGITGDPTAAGVRDRGDRDDPIEQISAGPHPGGLCPKCKLGVVDYDGCLNLRCTQCDYVEGGVFT